MRVISVKFNRCILVSIIGILVILSYFQKNNDYELLWIDYNLDVHPQVHFFDRILYKPKYILLFTTYFGHSDWLDAPRRFEFIETDGTPCDARNCVLTYDKTKYNISDAVLFHSRDLSIPSKLKVIRQQSPKNKLWIWHDKESPINLFMNITPYDGLFNWTSTYSPLSEIFTPYYSIVPLQEMDRRPPIGNDFSKYKSRMVMAAISNCNGKRIKMIQKLRQYIPFYVFGHCGKKLNPYLGNCPTYKNKLCKRYFAKFKFYFSMENSFCDDYVTEKFYRNGLLTGLVPIVLGGADYYNIAPKHSYINILDFKDMRSLADYLKYLDKNSTAYNEYHKWRYSYKVVKKNFICETCKILWKRNGTENKNDGSGVNITEFWSKKKRCRQWKDVLSKYIDV